ncbi:MAG: hypothetical protein ABUM51_07570 [Bacteroidota bacterium]
MKKLAAIFFLTLFLFNLVGYRCYFYYLQQKEQSTFEATLDKEIYDEKELITFKMPLSLPYQPSWKEFERVDGEITIDGVIYKYVKRKIEDGQLVLLCLPYYKKMNLVKASTEFGSHGNDLTPMGKKGNTATPGKSKSLNEYEENIRWVIDSQRPGLIYQYALLVLPRLTNGFLKYPGKPPQIG